MNWIDTIVADIMDGDLDDGFAQLQDAMMARIEARRQENRKLLKASPDAVCEITMMGEGFQGARVKVLAFRTRWADVRFLDGEWAGGEAEVPIASLTVGVPT